MTNTNVRPFTANGTSLFAGTFGGGVYRSTDSGANWIAVNNGLTDLSIEALVVDGPDVYAGTNTGGIFRSPNNGASWSAANTGLTNLTVRAFTVHGGYIFAGTLGGVYRSNDNGANWSQINNGISSVDIRAFAASGANIFAGSIGGIYRSADNGINWTPVISGLTHTSVHALAFCGTNLYAGTLSFGGVFLSTNNGTSWTAQNSGLTNTTVTSLAVSNLHLFAGTLGGGVFRDTNICSSPLQNEACITWDLFGSDSVSSISGNISGVPEVFGPGSTTPFMSIYGYNNGQQLWVGNLGGTWVPNDVNNPTLDLNRFIEFNTSPLPGNSLTVSNISFNYGDLPLGMDFKILNFQAYYSTDQWLTSTLLNVTGVDYLNTVMQQFTRSVNVVVASGTTFSLRMYPYPILNGSAMTPSFATHNTVKICGTTNPKVVDAGTLCGTKYNDKNSNGVRDAGEPGLPNWRIGLGIASVPFAVTDSIGEYCFYNLPPGTYTVSEVQQSGWQQTSPSPSGTHVVTLPAGATIDSLDFGNTEIPGEACITWDLAGSDSVTSLSGNIHGQSEILSAGTSAPLMSVFGYSGGQQLWVGTTGWVTGPLDPLRFVEFNASANSGNILTVTNVSFRYGDHPLSIDFNIVNFRASYSTDNWITSTVLNATALVYLNTAMTTFSIGVNVPVPNGQTFSLRIYPYALQNGIAMTPTFAIHADVAICGTTVPVKDERCVTPPDSMVAWWTLDEPSGIIAHDRSGFNNSGTYFNGPLPTAGMVAGGLQFDGVNDYVEVPDHPELNFGSGNISFDAWIRTTDSVGAHDLVDKRTSATAVLGYSFFLNNGKLSLQLADGLFTNYTSPLFVADGRWHHIAVTVDRDDHKGIIFYIDGVPAQYGDPTTHQGSLNNTGSLRIGSQSFSVSYVFEGSLDEIELFNRVITQTEIVSIMNAGSAGKCKTPVSVHEGSRGNIPPPQFQLEQNFPNPFNPSTVIRYEIPDRRFVNIAVYDALGREIRQLVNEVKQPGYYEYVFDAAGLPSGMYVVIFKTADFIQSKKMILLK